MADDFTITEDYTKLRALVRKAGYKVEDLIEKAAQDCASQASANTSRVDTGLMKNSWKAKRAERMIWTVGDYGCGYALFHEFGFHHHISGGFVPATPMLRPAFVQSWNALLSALGRAGVLL